MWSVWLREADIMLPYKCLQISVAEKARRKFLFLLSDNKNFLHYFPLLRTAVIWLKVMAVKLVPLLYSFVSLCEDLLRELNLYRTLILYIMSNMNDDKNVWRER